MTIQSIVCKSAIAMVAIAFCPFHSSAEGSLTANVPPVEAASTSVLTDTTGVVDLDEVVIVAQPKESVRLRLQPLASTVFTDDELQRFGGNSLSAISRHVPSFVVPEYGSRYTSSVYVRGIGSRSGDASVGLYFDNIPLVNRSTYNRHLYMLDRIDLLRGPQGTLYGINTEGGLLRVYSKNPMYYQGTDLSFGFGTGLYGNAEVAHYHRPSDNFAFSATAFYTGLRGFFDNANTGSHADQSHEFGGRMRFVLNVTPRLSFDLTADYQYANQNAFVYGEYSQSDNSFSDPSTTFDNGYKRQMLGVGLNVAYKSPTLLLSSATGWQFLDDHMAMDQDYLPGDYMRLEQSQLMNAITQEITLRSLRPSRWQHTSGVFFSQQWLRTSAPVSFGADMNSMIVANMGMPPAVQSMVSITDNHVPGFFHTPRLNVGVYHESRISLARRLSLTLGLRYDMQHASIDYSTEALFRLGVAMPGQAALSSLFSSVFDGHASETYNQLLPKLALTWTIDERGSNVYAVASKGFRAGGYNLQMFSDIFQTEQRALGRQLMGLMQGDMHIAHDAADIENINRTITYEPETSWNFEAGAHLNLFQGRLHADLSAYYMRVSNQQLSVMASRYGYGRMMVNAGRSGSGGVEVALRGAAFGDRLSWTAAYSYTHATFRSYADSVTVTSGETTTTQLCDYRGRRVPFVPEHTFSASADWQFQIAGNKRLNSVTVGADITGNGPTYWDIAGTLRQNLYAIVGAHVTFNFGNVRLNLWGRNLTNTRYATFLVNSAVDGIDRSFAQRGNPLRAGFDLDIHF